MLVIGVLKNPGRKARRESILPPGSQDQLL
jgi:hypothetical protein